MIAFYFISAVFRALVDFVVSVLPLGVYLRFRSVLQVLYVLQISVSSQHYINRMSESIRCAFESHISGQSLGFSPPDACIVASLLARIIATGIDVQEYTLVAVADNMGHVTNVLDVSLLPLVCSENITSRYRKYL